MTGFDQSDGKCGTGDATDAGNPLPTPTPVLRMRSAGSAAKMYKTVKPPWSSFRRRARRL